MLLTGSIGGCERLVTGDLEAAEITYRALGPRGADGRTQLKITPALISTLKRMRETLSDLKITSLYK